MTALTSRFDNALTYPRVHHAGHTRKGTDIPYVSTCVWSA